MRANNLTKLAIDTGCVLFALLFFMQLPACTSSPHLPDTETAKDRPSPAEIMEKVSHTPSRDKKRQVLPPLAELKPEVAVENKMPFEGKLFSLSARSTPIRDVLLGLAMDAELNLVIEKGLHRKMGLDLQ